ncbi:inositol monophosphatase [Candidatus Woesearchaeota archaeon]|nr:inositol monophosphatase [Candidatus Woesearchaeota archaeon]
MNFRQTAVKAAKEAGRIQLSYFRKNISIKKKKDGSFVTRADIESTKAIRKIVSKEFPGHNLLCEELGGSGKSSQYRWIIDPLDGTHNFMMGNPLFGTSIALEYKKEVILGAIYLPFLKRLYLSEKGKGAFCNGKRIRVSEEKDTKNCMFVFNSHLRKKPGRKIRALRKLAGKTRDFRVFGVSVYNNILVAEGMAGFNIDFDSHSWDHSAALLTVEEAGGKVTDLCGNKWDAETKDYLASNGHIHDKILKIIEG